MGNPRVSGTNSSPSTIKNLFFLRSNPARRDFLSLVELVIDDPRSKMIIFDIDKYPDIGDKLRGFAQLTDRLEVNDETVPEDTSLWKRTTAWLKNSDLEPEMVFLLREGLNLADGQLDKIREEFHHDHQLGLLETDPDWETATLLPTITALRYPALQNTLQVLRQTHQKTVPEELEIADLFKKLTNLQWQVDSPRYQPEQITFSSLIQFARSKLTGTASIFVERIPDLRTWITRETRLFLKGNNLLSHQKLQTGLATALAVIILSSVTPRLDISQLRNAFQSGQALLHGSSTVPAPNDPSGEKTGPSPEPTSRPRFFACAIGGSDFQPLEKPLRLVIPTVKIDLPVKNKPLVNGTWQPEDYVANFAEGTSLPNNVGGNTALYGHDRPHAMRRIKNLHPGELVFVETEHYRFIYQTRSLARIKPEQVEVFHPTKQPTLTLLTCNGLWSQDRYVIAADLVRIEKLNCSNGNKS